MKKYLSNTIVLALIVGLFTAYMPFLALHSDADTSQWKKGASFYPTGSTYFSSQDFQQSLQNFKKTGGTDATFIIEYRQQNLTTSQIDTDGNTPTDSSLLSGINYAHSLGLHVMLKPHIETTAWRAYINATDRAAWYSNYSSLLNHLGDIGQQTNTEGICIGTELSSMADSRISDNNQQWLTMIASLRTHFSGFLTYSANWGGGALADEAVNLLFWSQLDYIGFSAYFPVGYGVSNPSVQDIVNSWSYHDTSKIKMLSDKFHKPILFTEVGYRSVDGANNAPYDWNMSGNANETLQANLYEGLFQYWNSKPYFAGMYIWMWNPTPRDGGPTDTNYYVSDKKAEAVITKWYRGSSTVTPPPTPPAVPAQWTLTGSASSKNIGDAVTVTTRVKASQSVTDSIVDVEVYTSSGSLVYQKYFEHQNFAANVEQSFLVNWTPTQAGNYIVKAGTFNNTWSKNYAWNNGITSFTVNTQPNPVPPAPTPTPTPVPTPVPTPTPTPTPLPWSITGTASARYSNEPVQITVVARSPQDMSNSNISIVVYNASNTAVFTKYYGQQNLSANTPKTFSFDWTSNQPGSYTVKAGIFDANWTKTYIWNESIVYFTTKTSPTSPTPTPNPQNSVFSIGSLTLYDARNEKALKTLNNSDTINLSQYPEINIDANTSGSVGNGSALFSLDGNKLRIENVAPFSIGGNGTGTDIHLSWMPPLGTHTITVQPYSQTNGTGIPGKAYSIQVTFIK